MPGDVDGLEDRAELSRASNTLLIVDDDRGIREALTEALEDDGFEVMTACDGAEALTILRARRPDLMLLDLMMPKVSGWQLIEQLRLDSQLRNLPIFVVAAAGYSDTVQGGYPIFVKPLNLNRLIRAIRSYLD